MYAMKFRMRQIEFAACDRRQPGSCRWTWVLMMMNDTISPSPSGQKTRPERRTVHIESSRFKPTFSRGFRNTFRDGCGCGTSLTTQCEVDGTDRLEPEPPLPLYWYACQNNTVTSPLACLVAVPEKTFVRLLFPLLNHVCHSNNLDGVNELTRWG